MDDMNPDNIEQRLEQLYSSAQSANSEGLIDAALDRCEEAMALLESYGEDTEHHSYADFVMLMGDIHWGSANYEEAYRAYSRVVQNEPERLDAQVAMGVALFHLCRFSAAKVVLEMCSLNAPEDGETWYYLGLIALREGKRRLARRYFETVEELDEDRFPMPAPVRDEVAVESVKALIERVPEPMRGLLLSAPIEFEDCPPEWLLHTADPPIDPTVLGVFEGVAMGEDTENPNAATLERIVLFRDNIALLKADPAVLEEELWNSLKQEIAHFLDLSEEELDERGLE